jgi:hypothetical protein
MTIPRELLRSAPRPVELKAAGKAMVVLALLLALGGVSGGTLLQIKTANDTDAVAFRAMNGMTAEGRIVTSEPRKGKNEARMTYEFRVSDVTYSGRLRQGGQLPVGSTLSIGYLPANPADNWAMGHEPKGTPFWLPSLMGLTALALAGCVAFSLRSQQQLLSDGRAAIAKALTCRRVSHGSHGHHYTIEYEYRQMNGLVYKGKLRNRAAVTADTDFILLCEPDNPKKARKYPFSFVRVAE